MPRTLPTTTTWARSSSTPEEHEATEENSDRSRITSASVGISISPSATAMPSAVQPLETSIECRVSSVNTSLPRLLASRMVSIVRSGVSESTSATSVMPALAIASVTAAATLLIIAVRPMSSGSSTSLIAKPTVSRGSSEAGADAGSTVAKMVACGEMMPSVPPDQTIGICLTCSAVRLPLAVITSRKARSAMIRV